MRDTFPPLSTIEASAAREIQQDKPVMVILGNPPYSGHSLLPRIFGFELLVAPYAVAHLKLGLLLEETGYKFDTDERLRIYLNNTLDFTTLKEDADAFSAFINNRSIGGA